MRQRSTELYGLVTDKTRRMLVNTGWEKSNGAPELWMDPVSKRWFTEPEATAIQLKRWDAVLRPEAGIPSYLKYRRR